MHHEKKIEIVILKIDYNEKKFEKEVEVNHMKNKK